MLIGETPIYFAGAIYDIYPTPLDEWHIVSYIAEDILLYIPSTKISLPCDYEDDESRRKVRLHYKDAKSQKHTTAGIRWWSPTQLLISRYEA